MIRQSCRSLCLLILCLTVVVVATPLQAQEQTRIEVSPNGPLKTLNDARLKVRELKKTNPDQPIEVMIKGGVYPLHETVVFGLEDSGKAGAPITYKASPGESPVFTGGVSITGWKKLASDPAGVSDKAQGKLWAAPIPKGFAKSWVIKSLYDGDTLLKRAKSKGFKYAKFEKENDYNRQGKKLTSTLKYEGDPVAPFDRTIHYQDCLLYTSPSPRDGLLSRMPSSA